MPMRIPIAWSAIFLVVSLSCVSREHGEVRAAREAYENCIAKHAKSHSDCGVLQERFLEAQRRYHDSSRRAWSCDPAQEECPTKR